MRLANHHGLSVAWWFQSTHLVWGATGCRRVRKSIDVYFNPRTSCEVRPFPWDMYKENEEFQSTHLVWGATFSKISLMNGLKLFQSTHLVWGATSNEPILRWIERISIHAPRVRCDNLFPHILSSFLVISIHAPRVRCDQMIPFWSVVHYNFNPRTSCEVRLPETWTEGDMMMVFQSTHLVWGATKR